MANLFLLSPFLLSSCVSKAAFDQDQALINHVMSENKKQFDECFFQAKSKNPELRGGRIVIRFEHSVDGYFIAPRTLQRFIGSADVESCLEQTLTQIQTERPRTRGPVDLEWEFYRLAENSGNQN